MKRLITCAGLAIICTGSCAHLTNKNRTDRPSGHMQNKDDQVFCSEADVNAQKFRLTVDMINQGPKSWTLHKQFDLPYFKKEARVSPARTAKELLLWQDDRIILAEIIPIETKDIFTVSLSLFERTKNVSLTSNVFVQVRLCEDAEMSLNSKNKQHQIRVRLELIGKNTAK